MVFNPRFSTDLDWVFYRGFDVGGPLVSNNRFLKRFLVIEQYAFFILIIFYIFLFLFLLFISLGYTLFIFLCIFLQLAFILLMLSYLAEMIGSFLWCLILDNLGRTFVHRNLVSILYGLSFAMDVWEKKSTIFMNTFF